MLLLALLILQDVAESRRALQNAVQAGDEPAARSAMDALVDLQTPEAVDVLLSALGSARRAESDRDGERRAISGQLHEVEKKWETVNKQHAQATAEKNTAKANDFAKQSQECSKQATALRTQLSAIEPKLRGIGAIRRMLAEGLGKFAGDSAVAKMIEQLSSSKDWTIRSGIASAFEAIRRADVLEALVKAASSEREAAVKVSIVDAMAAHGQKTTEVIGALRDALRGSDIWQITAAVLQAARTLKAVELADALIDAMARFEGRLRYDIQEVLVALTGHDKGIAPDAWKSWFEAHRDDVLAGKLKGPGANGKDVGGTTFFGIPVKSTRVLFVLDRSGSMMEPADWIPQESTGDRLPPELKAPTGSRKIDIARWQLKKVIALLPNGAEFNIVFYHGTFEAYKPQMIKLTDASRKDAFKYIDSLEPFGQTNVFDSVERALQFAMGPDGKLNKNGPDTIYLVSDGLPNRGKYVNPNDILAHLGKINATLKLAINTIWVGTAPKGDEKAAAAVKNGETFMDRLAKENGGKFVNGK